MVALLVFLLQLCLVFVALPGAQATIFVTAPAKSTTCQAGQPCLVEWLDNGEAPSLTSIGPCHVGLYNGQAQLVQQIEPANVASVHSLTFTPDPAAGQDSDLYYINFTSVNPVGNPPSLYSQYSPSFALSGMSGSLASPVPSDTQPIAVPSSVADPSSNGVSSTIVISLSLSSTASSSTPTSVSSSSPSSSAPSSTAPVPASTSSSPSSSFVTSRTSSQTTPSTSSTLTSSSSSSSASPSGSAAASSAAPHVPSSSLWRCALFLVPSLLAISLL